ncbi:MAG: penicillin-binding protein, partial [Phototrophicales bacterium]
ASGGARTTVRLSDIAPEVLHAVVSIENERFFSDPGWDPIAIVRAFLDNLTSGQIVSGASTITQQIARRLVMQDNTASAERKLQEIVIAAEIARTYDKEFILE